MHSLSNAYDKITVFCLYFFDKSKKEDLQSALRENGGEQHPNKGAASSEYALGFIDTLIPAKLFYLKTAGLVRGINLLKMFEIPHRLFAHKNRVAFLSGIKDALHQMYTFHWSYAQW